MISLPPNEFTFGKYNADIPFDIYAGDKLVHKFIRIDKLSTAFGSNDGKQRPYRYGYGIDDVNFNGVKDPGEKKSYFEFSDYSTSYIFYERN